MYQTDMYEGMLAETITLPGYQGNLINAYFARPLGAGPFPGVVLIHHLPGWDTWYREATRKFAAQGYAALTPNLYYREGHGTPEDVAARARAHGGAPDDQVMGDVQGALQTLLSLPYANGKVGVFGTCSGGRHAFLAACRIKGFAAAFGLDKAINQAGKAVSQAANNMARCPQDGTLAAAGTKFCPECGARVIQDDKCKKCGAKLQPGAKFCTECGEKTS